MTSHETVQDSRNEGEEFITPTALPARPEFEVSQLGEKPLRLP